MADRQPFTVPGPRWLYVAVVAAMLLELVFGPAREPPRPPERLQPPDPRFPELAGVDPEVLALVRSWDGIRVRVRREPPFEQHVERTATESGPETRKRIYECGVEAAKALLYVLIEEYREPEGADGVVHDITGDASMDERFERPGMMLGELADAEVRRLLVRGLRLREFHPAFRRSLVVALCQPQHAAALDFLVARALDRQEDPNFRRAILLRLPRLNFFVHRPKALRALLYQPFEDLDILAASTLARMGDPEAPSLVLAGFGRDVGDNYLLNAAYCMIHAADDVRARLLERIETGPKTDFERLQNARPGFRSFEEVLAAGDDFDLADAALLLTDCDEATRRLTLQRLDNFAHFLRRQFESTDPEARIAVLNEWCSPRSTTVSTNVGAIRYSFLPTVLKYDHGNCLGCSTLYVALGQRLGLPLFGVGAPNHCFVRYDDGTFRRNIETTEHGVERPDDSYFGPEARARAPDTVPRGVFLANLSPRRMLADVLSNYSALRMGEPAVAAKAARRAVTLDPLNVNARSNLAWALFRMSPANEAEVLEQYAAAIELWPGSPSPYLSRGECLLHYGRPARALPDFERARALADSPRARVGLATGLARLGETERARDLLAKDVVEHPGHLCARVAELEVTLREDPERAPALVPEIVEATNRPLRVRAAAARVLLDTGHARLALDVLAPAHEMAIEANDGDGKREFYRAHARALYACGQRLEAHAVFERLCDFHPDDFFLKELRRTLGED